MTLLIVAFLLALLVGLPIFIALGGASLIYTHFIAGLPDFVVLHRMAGGVDSFPLIAVPFFILAGNLMNSAGITNRIYDFATAAVGWLRGGLGHVNVVGSVIFAGMSGTAVADAGGLGTIEIKAMRDHGYPADFAVGITAASSTIGPIIPPSLPMVIFGVMANVSIGQLFAAGFLPGLLMAVVMMLYVTWYARANGIGGDVAFRWGAILRTFTHAVPALMTPVIIIGGMASGAFTPTEAAIAACAWALFIGAVFDPLTEMLESRGVSYDRVFSVMTLVVVLWALAAAFTPLKVTDALVYAFGFNMLLMSLAFIYFRFLKGASAKNTLGLKRFYLVSTQTIETTAGVLIIVGAASLFGWVLTVTQVTEQVTAALLGLTTNPIMLLLIINLILLVVGCFMETIAAISILVPVFMPAVLKVGIDPVQFGVIMVLNLMIGLLTPPVGMVLFVLSRVSGLSFDRTVKAVLPFLIPLLIVLVLISIFPQITLYLPTLWYR